MEELTVKAKEKITNKEIVLSLLKQGMIQTEIAKVLGKSQSYISYLKKKLVAEGLISEEEIKAAKSNAFDIDVSKLLSENKTVEEIAEELKISPNRVLKSIKRLKDQKEELKSIIEKVKMAKQERNWKEVKRLQTRMLEINPGNVIAIKDLVVVAKQEGDWEEVKRLQTRRLELEPDNVRAISDLVVIAKKKMARSRKIKSKKKSNRIRRYIIRK